MTFIYCILFGLYLFRTPDLYMGARITKLVDLGLVHFPNDRQLVYTHLAPTICAQIAINPRS